jgi:small multidrug resistance pump
MSAWTCLAIAIALEIAGTAALKVSDGFSRPAWGLTAIGLYGACFWAFAPALKSIPVGVAYAVWAGVGIAAAGVIGVLFFGDRLGLIQCLFIGLVLVGAVGLRLTSPGA